MIPESFSDTPVLYAYIFAAYVLINKIAIVVCYRYCFLLIFINIIALIPQYSNLQSIITAKIIIMILLLTLSNIHATAYDLMNELLLLLLPLLTLIITTIIIMPLLLSNIDGALNAWRYVLSVHNEKYYYYY